MLLELAPHVESKLCVKRFLRVHNLCTPRAGKLKDECKAGSESVTATCMTICIRARLQRRLLWEVSAVEPGRAPASLFNYRLITYATRAPLAQGLGFSPQTTRGIPGFDTGGLCEKFLRGSVRITKLALVSPELLMTPA